MNKLDLRTLYKLAILFFIVGGLEWLLKQSNYFEYNFDKLIDNSFISMFNILGIILAIFTFNIKITWKNEKS